MYKTLHEKNGGKEKRLKNAAVLAQQYFNPCPVLCSPDSLDEQPPPGILDDVVTLASEPIQSEKDFKMSVLQPNTNKRSLKSKSRAKVEMRELLTVKLKQRALCAWRAA